MRPLSIKTHITLVTAGMLLLCLAVGIFVIQPSMKKFRSTQQDIYKTQVFLEKQYVDGQNRRESLRRLKEIQQEVKKFENTLIRPGDELAVITTLEDLAGETISQDLSVDFAEGKDKKNGQLQSFYTFSILGKGKFEDLVEYMKKIDQLPYHLIIDNLSFNKLPTDDDTLTLKFRAKIYAAEK